LKETERKYLISSNVLHSGKPHLFLVMLVLVGIAILPSCKVLQLSSATTNTPGTGTLKLYDPANNELHPDFVVYHSGVDESTVYFRLLVKELLFNQANAETRDQSRVKLSYELYSSYSEQVMDQRGEQDFVVNKDEVRDNYIGSVKIDTEEGKSYLLKIIITDQIRQLSSIRMILLDRFNPRSQQNFLLVNYPGSDVAFERFFYPSETFRIVTQNPPQSNLRVAYYKPFSQIPKPPYSIEESLASEIEPDSVWTIQSSLQNLFRLENEGVYQLYPDQSSMNGVYAANFGNTYPQIQKTRHMIPPVQYIATAEEYRKISEAVDSKKAVDDFWLDRGESFAIGRELIRVYYTRVVFANLYFSSDKEGWLTDRGMIYVLMGPPDLVNRSETGEAWVYKQADTNQKYTFEFYLASDPIKGYEFVLKRSENHRTPWNMAVQSWRDGKIFSLQ